MCSTLRHFGPIGTFGVSIEQAQIGDEMFVVIIRRIDPPSGPDQQPGDRLAAFRSLIIAERVLVFGFGLGLGSQSASPSKFCRYSVLALPGRIPQNPR
jgi:hypothetical protein